MSPAIIEGMSACIHSLDRTKFIGACFTSDVMRDGAWAQRHSADLKYPVYWVLTENATAIGFDRSLTVDYYRKNSPGTVLGAFVFTNGKWSRI